MFWLNEVIMKNIFFVDSENVGDSWLDLFDYLGDEDLLLVFYTDKSPHMSYSNLIRLKQSPVNPEFIHCDNGTDNALDFQLSTYLGSLTVKNPDDNLIIVTRDKGFDVVIKFWAARGYHVCRKAPSIFYTLSNNEPPQEIPDTEDIEDDIIVTEDSPTQSIEYNEEEVDDLLKCTGKANLSIIHNILISIYGKENGSFIYNIIKKPSYEIAKVNWQKKTKYRKFLHIVYSNASISISDDFFKKLYPQKANLENIHKLFVSKYGQQKGTEYYNYYKTHAEFLKKTF